MLRQIINGSNFERPKFCENEGECFLKNCGTRSSEYAHRIVNARIEDEWHRGDSGRFLPSLPGIPVLGYAGLRKVNVRVSAPWRSM